MKRSWKWDRRMGIDFGKITLGALLLGFSLNMFFEPYNLVAGGITGLGMVLKELSLRWFGWELPLWLSNILLNAPLFIGGYFLQGRAFILKTGYATMILSLGLYLSSSWGYYEGDLLINTVYGGVIGGAGIGLVLSASATTGGSDLLASILHYFTRHISVAVYLFLVDGIIIVLSILVFGVNLALYAIIGIYLTSWVADKVVDGLHYSKALFIISDQNEEISKRLLEELERGATGIPVIGKYTGEQREMLYVVMSVKETVIAKRIVKEVDPSAFMMITDTKEVLGEGFSEH